MTKRIDRKANISCFLNDQANDMKRKKVSTVMRCALGYAERMRKRARNNCVHSRNAAVINYDPAASAVRNSNGFTNAVVCEYWWDRLTQFLEIMITYYQSVEIDFIHMLIRDVCMSRHLNIYIYHLQHNCIATKACVQ